MAYLCHYFNFPNSILSAFNSYTNKNITKEVQGVFIGKVMYPIFRPYDGTPPHGLYYITYTIRT